MRDAELVEIATEFRDGLIGKTTSGDGFCAVVSWPLAAYLRALHGLECECVESDLEHHLDSPCYEHVWIKLPDGRVLDATYDQFCSEEPVKVYLGKPTEFHATPSPDTEGEM